MMRVFEPEPGRTASPFDRHSPKIHESSGRVLDREPRHGSTIVSGIPPRTFTLVKAKLLLFIHKRSNFEGSYVLTVKSHLSFIVGSPNRIHVLRISGSSEACLAFRVASPRVTGAPL